MSNKITQNICLDFAQPYINPFVYAKRGDFNSRCLSFNLTNKGAPVILDNDTSVIFNLCRPDGAKKSFACVVSGGLATVTLDSWMLAVEGEASCDISVISENSRLSTSTFKILVDNAPAGSAEIAESEHFDILTQMINACNNAIAAAELATANANTAAENGQDAINRIINDARESTTSTFSSQKINEEINRLEGLINELRIMIQHPEAEG